MSSDVGSRLRRILTIAWFVACPALALADDGAAQRPVVVIATQAIDVDSGNTQATSPGIVWSYDVRVPDAAWVRLNLTGTVLTGDESAGKAAYLRIMSLADGAVQTMHASHLVQSGYHSAYFNGDSVRIELIATQSSAGSRVRIAEALYEVASPPNDMPTPHSYCDNEDNRDLSDSGRAARIILSSGTIGTVFMIDDANHCFLGSGSIAGSINATAVIEFHAPLTLPDGTTLMHPPPELQYTVDLSSIQRFAGAVGSGDNWAYFGANANSTSSLTPFQTEGVFFERAAVIPTLAGSPIRTYGNGFTQPPIFRTWSFVQKTEVGTLAGVTGTRVNFRADLTSGDSGAAVLDESNGRVIAIATDDGCTEFGGSNAGTAITNPKLRTAINHPLGVCVALVYSYPNGIPTLLNPAGGSVVRVNVQGVNGAQQMSNSGQLHYNAGAGWITVPMTEVTPNVYDATFPAFPCGTFVDYYFSAATTTGVRVPDQLDNPVNTFRSAVATSVNVIASLNFEDAVGWTVENISLTGGAWERGVPVATGVLGAPTADYDGSGQCWLTGNAAGDSDVDGGPTRLRSPTYNLSATSNAFISYARWFTNFQPDVDRLSVQISNNGGLSFTTFENIADTVGWQVSRHKISDLMPITASMRFRFSVQDTGNNSRTEAAVDAFSIIDYVCAAACTKADVDNNGVKDGRDVAAFVAAVLSPAPGSQPFCSADMDNDGTLEPGDDVAAFVSCLINGTCP